MAAAEPVNMRLLVFAILAYCVVSLSVVYFNWWVFTVGFKYPVFVSWIQQIVGLIMFLAGSYLASYFSSLRPLFPPPTLRKEIIVKVLPLTCSFVLMVGLANVCLQKTLISTYQVARSLTLLFVMILSYVMLRQKETWMSIFACGLMVIGFMAGSLDPSTLTFMGLLTGGLSSFFQSLYNVYIKKSLAYVQDNNQLLLFYNVFLSAFLFLPVVLVSEDLVVFREALGQTPASEGRLGVIWGSMIFSGILGTTLNMTTYLTVKVTSPLTFNIVGFSKSLVQSMGGIVFLGDRVTPASASGILLCLTGSAVYTKSKFDEQKAKEGAAPLISSGSNRDMNELSSSEIPERTLKQRTVETTSTGKFEIAELDSLASSVEVESHV